MWDGVVLSPLLPEWGHLPGLQISLWAELQGLCAAGTLSPVNVKSPIPFSNLKICTFKNKAPPYHVGFTSVLQLQNHNSTATVSVMS